MLTIVEASADRWDDLADLLGERGDPARCWCQYYRGEGPYQHQGRERNRAALQRQVSTAAVPHGLLAYDDDKPVGWCALAPRADYPRLRQMRAAQATQDSEGLWSVTCFVVRVGYRRQGLTGRLLADAVEFAARHGARILEAYPVDPPSAQPAQPGCIRGCSRRTSARGSPRWHGRLRAVPSSGSSWRTSGLIGGWPGRGCDGL